MKNKSVIRVVLTGVFVFLAAGLAAAHDVVIHYQAKLGESAQLQPGTYRVELVKDEGASKAAFYRGKELVVEVPVKLVSEAKEYQQTEVHYQTLDEGRVINQIRVAGWKERLVFREPEADAQRTN